MQRDRLLLLSRQQGTGQRCYKFLVGWVGVGDGRRQAAGRRTGQWSGEGQRSPVCSHCPDVLLQRGQSPTSPCPGFCHPYLVSTNSQVKNRPSQLGVRPTVHPPVTVRALRDFFPQKVTYPHRPHWLASGLGDLVALGWACCHALWVSALLQVHHDQILCCALYPHLLSDLQAGGAGEPRAPCHSVAGHFLEGT